MAKTDQNVSDQEVPLSHHAIRDAILSWDAAYDILVESTRQNQGNKTNQCVNSKNKTKVVKQKAKPKIRKKKDLSIFDNQNVPTQFSDSFDNVEKYFQYWCPMVMAELKASVLNKIIGDNRCQVLKPLLVQYTRQFKGDRPNTTIVKLCPIRGSTASCSLSRDDRLEKECLAFLCVDTDDFMQTPLCPSDRSNYPPLQCSEGYRTIGKAIRQKMVSQSSSQSPGQNNAVDVEWTSPIMIPVLVVSCQQRSVNGHQKFECIKVEVNDKIWGEFDFPSNFQMYLYCLASTTTALREFAALCALRDKKVTWLEEHILNTDKRKEKNKRNNSRIEDDEDKFINDMLKYQDPNWLEQCFNRSQRLAIASAIASREGFVLIKGPPGTGKTHTVVGALNAFHWSQYRAYYDSLIENTAGSMTQKRPRILVCAQSNIAVDNIVLKIVNRGFVNGMGKMYKPPIIRAGRGTTKDVTEWGQICIEDQCNAVINCDTQLLDKRLKENEMKLGHITNCLLALRAKFRRIKEVCTERISPSVTVEFMEDPEKPGGGTPYFINEEQQTLDYNPPPMPSEGKSYLTLKDMPIYTQIAGEMVALTEDINALESHILCLKMVKEFRSRGVDSREESREFEKLKRSVEINLLNNAQIVFTTLQSAGIDALKACDSFPTCIVDEAAQGVELSTLIPLELGVKRCALIGDPHQLPATTFSADPSSQFYERSLFERLEAGGHKVYLLNTQYRMHSKISAFPMKHFYGSQLFDAEAILSPSYTRPFHNFLAPRVFFDVSRSSENRKWGDESSTTASSVSNSTEAGVVLNIFETLCALNNGEVDENFIPPFPSTDQGAEDPETRKEQFEKYRVNFEALIGRISGKIGIITPYKAQKREIEFLFKKKYGEPILHYVDINTVDAYQGKEKEIIIISTVRASSGGIGFLADTRRMNVAITRAMYGLFIVGQEVTLNRNPHWAEFVRSCVKEGTVIRLKDETSNVFHLVTRGNYLPKGLNQANGDQNPHGRQNHLQNNGQSQHPNHHQKSVYNETLKRKHNYLENEYDIEADSGENAGYGEPTGWYSSRYNNQNSVHQSAYDTRKWQDGSNHFKRNKPDPEWPQEQVMPWQPKRNLTWESEKVKEQLAHQRQNYQNNQYKFYYGRQSSSYYRYNEEGGVARGEGGNYAHHANWSYEERANKKPGTGPSSNPEAIQNVSEGVQDPLSPAFSVRGQCRRWATLVSMGCHASAERIRRQLICHMCQPRMVGGTAKELHWEGVEFHNNEAHVRCAGRVPKLT